MLQHKSGTNESIVRTWQTSREEIEMKGQGNEGSINMITVQDKWRGCKKIINGLLF